MKDQVFRRGAIYALILFCTALFPAAQALGHLNPRGHSPRSLACPSAPLETELDVSSLPKIEETDPAIELERISRSVFKKMDHKRLVVAMRLGEKLNFSPDGASAFPWKRSTGSAMNEEDADMWRVGDMIRVSAASFEDEKVIDEPEDWDEETVAESIADPLEPVNRIFFAFNDKLYFWVLKPVAKGYRYVIPEPFRVGFRNMFKNIAMPIRAVNCLLQGKVRGFGRELLRFVVNSTVGFLGFVDVASSSMHLNAQEEDFGQTLGVFGAGPGIYINWPIFGPSSIRDTFGLAGDFFVDPLTYLLTGTGETIAVRGGDRVNRTSLSIGDYESLKKSALDPYVSVRDAYFQYRRSKIER